MTHSPDLHLLSRLSYEQERLLFDHLSEHMDSLDELAAESGFPDCGSESWAPFQEGSDNEAELEAFRGTVVE